MAQQQTEIPGVTPGQRRESRRAKYPAAFPQPMKDEVMGFVERHRKRGGPSFNDLLVEGLGLAYQRARAALEAKAA